MRLRFFYQPVNDLEAASSFYRDELGLEEQWREGSAAALKFPGADVAIMIDEAPFEGTGGPFMVVEDVEQFYKQNRDRLHFLEEPKPIGPGKYARFTDPAGNVIRIMDDTTSNERRP